MEISGAEIDELSLLFKFNVDDFGKLSKECSINGTTWNIDIYKLSDQNTQYCSLGLAVQSHYMFQTKHSAIVIRLSTEIIGCNQSFKTDSGLLIIDARLPKFDEILVDWIKIIDPKNGFITDGVC